MATESSFNFEQSDADAGAVETARDRRRHPRVPHKAVFNLRPVSANGAGLSVVLQDLSISGMGIIHSDALRMGEHYQIPLTREGSNATDSLALVATVVRCEQLDDGLYSIGFQFNSFVNTNTVAAEISVSDSRKEKQS
jgi:hypothetical protein